MAMELQSFLNLVNYYRQFIEGHLVIAISLTDLLRKDKVRNWTLCMRSLKGCNDEEANLDTTRF